MTVREKAERAVAQMRAERLAVLERDVRAAIDSGLQGYLSRLKDHIEDPIVELVFTFADVKEAGHYTCSVTVTEDVSDIVGRAVAAGWKDPTGGLISNGSGFVPHFLPKVNEARTALRQYLERNPE